MKTDSIEQEIQAKGLTAPRITQADVEANIVCELYGTAGQLADMLVYQSGTKLVESPPLEIIPCSAMRITICVLELKNGFTVTGESACASPENFDAEIGRMIARQNAVQKIWPLMGYELRSKLQAIAELDSFDKKMESARRYAESGVAFFDDKTAKE